jgi:hypothetical protein
METLRDMEGLKRGDGARAVVHGLYRSIARPLRGFAPNRPKDHAILELEDGARIFLEAFDSGAARRSADERVRFEGKQVRVQGIVHAVMPAKGESPLAPCVSQIEQIEEAP